MKDTLNDKRELEQEAQIADFEDRLKELEGKVNKEYPNYKPRSRKSHADKVLDARLWISFISFLITLISLIVLFATT